MAREWKLPSDKLPTDLPIADIGLKTIANYSRVYRGSRLLYSMDRPGWLRTGEVPLGTSELLKAATESGYSIAGGGHSVAAIELLGLNHKFSHVSMGGGASITYLSGEPLPGIEALKKASSSTKDLTAEKETHGFGRQGRLSATFFRHASKIADG